LQENFRQAGKTKTDVFSEADFSNPRFTSEYADYLLGEVKDHLSFYYESGDYELFLKFFQYLNGHSRFTYAQYLVAFSAFEQFLDKNAANKPSFCESADGFLQFLYELNVIAYIRDTDAQPFFGFCFRERTPSNLSPKVRTHVRYDVHYGLMKSLDLGKHFRTAGPGIKSLD
jgi:hypothetical protein